MKQRDKLLASMTDDVAKLVLRHNYLQSQALSVAENLSFTLLDQQNRFMRTLERTGKLDRAIEFLPDDETVRERLSQRIGLTRPELAVLLAYSKTTLYEELLPSDLPDDPRLVQDLYDYFPPALKSDFRAADREASPAPGDHRDPGHQFAGQPRGLDLRPCDPREDRPAGQCGRARLRHCPRRRSASAISGPRSKPWTTRSMPRSRPRC